MIVPTHWCGESLEKTYQWRDFGDFDDFDNFDNIEEEEYYNYIKE